MMSAWQGHLNLEPFQYKCGFCKRDVGSDKGFRYTGKTMDHCEDIKAYIYLCPICFNPTFFDKYKKFQLPGIWIGENIDYINNAEVQLAYSESRNCFSVGAYTASAMLCRKLLMNIAVEKGANEGLFFKEYVEYLDSKGYIPPDGKNWVDKIRTIGNEATHKIPKTDKEQAEALIKFSEMLLRIVYEYPEMGKKLISNT